MVGKIEQVIQNSPSYLTETALLCLVTTQRSDEVLVIKWPRCFEVVYICSYLFSVLYKCHMMISPIRRRKKDQHSQSSCIVSVWVKFTCMAMIGTKKAFGHLTMIRGDLPRSWSLPNHWSPKLPLVYTGTVVMVILEATGGNFSQSFYWMVSPLTLDFHAVFLFS